MNRHAYTYSRLAKVFCLRRQGLTFRECGERVNASTERARQLFHKCCWHLKHTLEEELNVTRY